MTPGGCLSSFQCEKRAQRVQVVSVSGAGLQWRLVRLMTVALSVQLGDAKFGGQDAKMSQKR